MTNEATTRPRVVLYEGPGAESLEDGRRVDVLRSLLEGGYTVSRPSQDGSVAPADEAEHLVLGEFADGQTPTAAPGSATPLRFEDISGQEVDSILQTVQGSSTESEAEAPKQWTPWFPVIDYDRCTNCMQCLTFCLFDVYSVDDAQEITVQNESNCKTNCPACSRVCPEAAILFPKYKAGPINGEEVKEEDLERESMKVDISALLGGDIYASLRERNEKARLRFSTERDDSRALLERKRCLTKLKKTLDIPDEVLMTLPSAENIEERARRAKEKAAARQARSVSAQAQRPPSADDWGI